jgi:hypothetical protein
MTTTAAANDSFSITAVAFCLWFIIEIATYPEPRVLEQVLRDSMLVFLDRGKLPEVLTLVLHPRGKFRLSGKAELTSRLQLSRWVARWRVVKRYNDPQLLTILGGIQVLRRCSNVLAPWR